MTYSYQVEFEDGEGKTQILPYAVKRGAAEKRARIASRKYTMAYVVAMAGGDRVGHRAYGDGRLTETLGEGF